MLIDLTNYPAPATYALLTQAVVPRPIAWVLTQDAQGGLNLAPFSYFNVVCASPPILMISVGRRPDGREKDTSRNVRAHGRLVIHVASQDEVDAVNGSAASLEPGVSEVEHLHLETVPVEAFPLPRLARAPIAFCCHCERIVDIGSGPQSVIFAQVEQAYIADGVARVEGGRLTIDPATLRPLARLGGPQFGTLGEVLVRPRPD